MLALAKGNDRLLLKLLFYLGLRLSEARRLQRSDIKSINGEFQFSVLGKGNKLRKVTLSKKLSREIVEHLPSTGYLFRGREGGWVFVSVPGVPQGEKHRKEGAFQCITTLV